VAAEFASEVHLVPEPLVRLPIPPVQRQVDECFQELLDRLSGLGKPEARAHARVDVALRPEIAWVMPPPLQKVVCTGTSFYWRLACGPSIVWVTSLEATFSMQ